MGVWDTYNNRISSLGGTKRNYVLTKETRRLSSKGEDLLSYVSANIDGVLRDVSILSLDNINEKTICSTPGEDLICGSLVSWEDNYWLITEKDASNELYSRAKMVQCNHLLKWIDESDVIREQWCIIEDGTKYMTGEYEDRNFVVTRGDSRISMTIAKNEHTVKFGREHRFIIDDPEAADKLAYLLTKPLKVGRTYGGFGVYCFVLQESIATKDDNMELGIADYYKHFPLAERTAVPNNTDSHTVINITPNSTTDSEGRQVWL